MAGTNRLAFVAVIVAGVCCLAANSQELSDTAIRRRIEQHRTAQTQLVLVNAQGQPLRNAPVTVRQARHQFLFGCNAFRINAADTSQAQLDYQKRFSDLLNYATLGFYWGAYERTPGQPSFDRLKSQADWCARSGIVTKGHPLVWQQVQPRWIVGRPLEEVQALQLGRLTREVSAFKGVIDRWDVVNEAVVMPGYSHPNDPPEIPALARKLGTVELIRQAFEAARKANPNAVLVLNDYDVSPKYEKLIADCLAAGVGIDVIGIQSHMHTGYWGKERLWDVLTRFSRFNKPIHFTEVTVVSGPAPAQVRWHGPRHDDWPSTPEGEAKQAEQVAEFYSVLFSHPSVEAITWWDLSDNGAWLGAPSGLVRRDMTPKPAYEALMKRVKGEWWTGELKLTTDAQGRLGVRGFLGDYTVQAGSAHGTFTLDRRAASLKVVVR